MKIKNLLFLLIFLAGCSVKQLQTGKKAFPQEDNYIIKALVYENSGDFKEAAKIYMFLYKKTDKDVYYVKYLDSLFALKKYDEVLSFIC